MYDPQDFCLRCGDNYGPIVAGQVNGEITKTHAANVKGNAITLYDIEVSKFLDNTEKLKELNAKKPATMEETKALLKDVPGLVIEPAKKVSVSFKGK